MRKVFSSESLELLTVHWVASLLSIVMPFMTLSSFLISISMERMNIGGEKGSP